MFFVTHKPHIKVRTFAMPVPGIPQPPPPPPLTHPSPLPTPHPLLNTSWAFSAGMTITSSVSNPFEVGSQTSDVMGWTAGHRLAGHDTKPVHVIPGIKATKGDWQKGEGLGQWAWSGQERMRAGEGEGGGGVIRNATISLTLTFSRSFCRGEGRGWGGGVVLQGCKVKLYRLFLSD